MDVAASAVAVATSDATVVAIIAATIVISLVVAAVIATTIATARLLTWRPFSLKVGNGIGSTVRGWKPERNLNPTCQKQQFPQPRLNTRRARGCHVGSASLSPFLILQLLLLIVVVVVLVVAVVARIVAPLLLVLLLLLLLQLCMCVRARLDAGRCLQRAQAHRALLGPACMCGDLCGHKL